MNNLKIFTFFLIGVVSLSYACKKEEVNAQELVQKQLLGNWPLKYRIKTIYTNNVAGNPDTLIKYNPIDTLVFNEGGNLIKRNKTIISTGTYSVDVAGENITFSGTPAITQKLSFVRVTSIGLATETVVKSGSTETRTVIEDQLIK